MSKRLPYSIADINARLIAKFGPVVTRQNLLDFRASDGVFAAWLQKDASLKVGRGAYRIPGAEWTPADVASVTPSRKTRQTVVSVTPQMIAAPVSLAPVKTAVAPSAAVVTVAANARTEKTSAILSKL